MYIKSSNTHAHVNTLLYRAIINGVRSGHLIELSKGETMQERVPALKGTPHPSVQRCSQCEAEQSFKYFRVRQVLVLEYRPYSCTSARAPWQIYELKPRRRDRMHAWIY